MYMKKIFTTLIYLLSLYFVSFAQPGALDSTFAGTGKFIMPCSDYSCYNFGEINAIAIQPNGKIILVGGGVDANKADGNWDFAITRLNTNGTLDNSFGKNGTAYIDFSHNDILSYDEVLAVTLQTDGKIVVIGTAFDEHYDDSSNTYNHFDIGTARLNADGTPDKSFSNNGKELIDLSSLTKLTGATDSYDFGRTVTIKPNGKICIAGETFMPDSLNEYNYNGFVIQLNSDGTFDNNFGKRGINIFLLPETNESIFKIAVQGNDKLVVAGYSFSVSNQTSDFLAIRLNTNGSKDNSFGVNGIDIIDLGLSDYCYSMVIQPDGKILLGGTQEDPLNHTAGFALARLNSNGMLDNTFSGDGIEILAPPNDANEAFGGLALQQDGKIIQTGRFASYIYDQYYGSYNFEVVRFNKDGSPDSSFGNHGRSIIDFGNWTDYVQDISTSCAIQANGKIIAAGSSTVYPYGNTGPAAVRLLVTGKHITLDAPPDKTVNASLGQCTLAVNNIDPVIQPPTSKANVKYEMFGATTGSGQGSVSGKIFNPGATTVIYTLESDPLQRAIFTVTVNAVPGGALDFDGIDDRVNLGFVNAAVFGQFSFETWIDVRDYGSDKNGSCIFGDERNNNRGIYLGLDTNGYITTYHPNTGFVVSSYKVPLHTWTHIAIVQSYTNLDLYVNGTFIQTLLTAPNLLQQVDYNTSYLGAHTDDYTTFTRQFNGRMDEIRVWKTAICPAQIQNNFHCEIAPDYSYDLLDYYKINQGVAGCDNQTQSYLYAEVGYQGTLENFSLTGNKSNWVKGFIHDTCPAFSPLSLSCPGEIDIITDSGECGKIVDFEVIVNSGCSPDVTVTYSQNPGTFFPTGQTWVTVTATNGFGNETQCGFYVNVKDPLPPVLIPKDTSIALSMYSYIQLNPYDVIASVSDDCGLDPYYGLSVYPYYFDCSNLGPNTVTITATDVSGNITQKTATVTITPFVTSTTVEVDPVNPQYSDVAAFTATLHDADYFYIYGCITAPDVTFKIDSMVLGTAALSPDGVGNLVGTLNTVLSGEQPGKINVTATFSGGSGEAVQYNTVAAAQVNIAKENAKINYVSSQFVKTKLNSTDAIIPVGAAIEDSSDGYRGDVRNASVTFIIEPVTAGASVTGTNTITIPTLSLVNSDYTQGIAKGQFNVSVGTQNTKARFNVKVKTGNYYIGNITVPVIVSKQSDISIAGDNITSVLSAKPGQKNSSFNVVAMPNPSQAYFNLKVYSSDKVNKINIRVTDASGRLIESKIKLNIQENIILGAHYLPGVYIAEVTQGQNKKIMKLIKQ
jgi:uncharacterized delta-60 repeat protein